MTSGKKHKIRFSSKSNYRKTFFKKIFNSKILQRGASWAVLVSMIIFTFAFLFKNIPDDFAKASSAFPWADGEVTIDKVYFSGGQEVQTTRVNVGQNLTVRLKYNNTGNLPLPDVSITDAIPEGFNYVPGSLRNVYANQPAVTLSDSLISGDTLTVGPLAGYFGNSTSSAQTALEFGKKRYVYEVLCTAFGGQEGERTVYAVGNNPTPPDPNGLCNLSSVELTSSIDIQGKKYLYEVQCLLFSGQEGERTVYAAGNSPTPPAPTGYCNLSSVDESRSFDMYQNRYLYEFQCEPIINQEGERGIYGTGNTETPPSPTGLCNLSSVDVVRSYDLLDTNNGFGYIEYQIQATTQVEAQSTGTTVYLNAQGNTILDDASYSISVGGVSCDYLNPDPAEREISLGDAELRTDQDFTCTFEIKICPIIFTDTNANGVRNPEEPILSGVVVQLYDQTETTLINTLVTDGNQDTTCFESLAGGVRYKIVIPSPPDTNSTTGGNSVEVITPLGVFDLFPEFGYNSGIIYLEMPPGVSFSGLSVSPVEQLTVTNINPISVYDHRSFAEGWTVSCSFTRNFEKVGDSSLTLPIANRIVNKPQSYQQSNQNSGGINLGQNTTVTALNNPFSMAFAGPGSGLGITSISTNIDYTLPAFSLSGAFQTSLYCTVI